MKNSRLLQNQSLDIKKVIFSMSTKQFVAFEEFWIMMAGKNSKILMRMGFTSYKAENDIWMSCVGSVYECIALCI
jgi:hypothetical protein